MTNWQSSADFHTSRERPEHRWASQTIGVPDVCSPVKNFTPSVIFMLATLAYSWDPYTCHTLLFAWYLLLWF